MSNKLANLGPFTELVIVIEDNPVLRMLLEETLAAIGFASAAFDNTGSALSHLLTVNGKCVLIIADQGCPGDIQVFEFIRLAKEQWPLIPLILTSGNALDEKMMKPYTKLLSKPYTLDRLETAIATILCLKPLVLQASKLFP